MAHRSNQAVASQEQAAPQPPDGPPPARRFLIGWTTALLALGLSTAGLAGAVWLLRFSIAGFLIDAALAERGAEADFQIVNLDFDHAVLTDVRFGSATDPDAAIPRLEVRWTWPGILPALSSVHASGPQLHLRVDGAGRVSAGSLDRLSAGTPGRRRPSVPNIELVIEDGRAVIDAPFGQLNGAFRSSGVLGQDFSAVGRIAETSVANGAHALERGGADLIVVSRDGALDARLDVDLQRLRWSGIDVQDAHVRLVARTPLDLARYDIEAAWRVGGLQSESVNAERLSGAAGLEALARDNSINPAQWEGEARVSAASSTISGNTMQRARFDARATGREGQGQGTWSLIAEHFAGLSLISEQPSANGGFRMDLRGNERLTGTGQINLARSRLDADAQQRLRDAFPDLGGSPVGPTFARAEAALDAAADRFDLTVPLAIAIDASTTRLRLSAPAQARAASGAALRLAALRTDAPALVMQWPGAAAHGALAIDLAGGGAPTTTLLLDTVDWSPDAPFEADGTLSLSNWRAENASIAADELNISIAVAPGGDGRVDLRGPARITGPVGDGEVRDMVANLDIAATWKPGWRVTPNGCLPIQLGGLDAAGLSFSRGGFALCPLTDALIAADANGALSGGFSIRDLALNGRMAGPEGQPARLSAANVIGRFSGRTGDMTLAIDAARPGLTIAMADDRSLSLAMAGATAAARIHDGTWSVDGDFRAGALSDPALPGTVTTIAGEWSAAPEDDGAVIRINAGEALLTANRPATDDERLLFNPLRLVNVDAVMRGGEVDATGAILLAEPGRQLANFTAHHDIGEGAGSTHIVAPQLSFDATLQPYTISERARGVVADVRGPASAIADVRWDHDTLVATGTLRADGLSMSTATMPVIQDVRGSVYFDDLFALTTPPGQVLNVGLLNPGLAVRDGRVQFQLLADQNIAIERAAFAFAGGVLQMTPTTLQLGQDETEIELTLSDVSASELITSLNIADLSATGRIEGSFPLRLTRRTAFIDHGVLRAQGEGGAISYTGAAGANATGPARLAFDALRSFRYDSLQLTLDGDINGEVVSSIEFSGRNIGEPVDLGEIGGVPGIGNVSVRGVPFAFNVHVTAPFRSLAQTAASITDPGVIINGGQRQDGPADDPDAPQADETVDRPPPGTR